MNYRWPDLLNKYLEGNISDTERSELYRQAALSKSKQAQLEDFTTKQGIMRQLKDLDKIDPAKVWERLNKQLDATRLRKMYRVRTMAAAVLIAILSTVVYYMFNLRQLSIASHRPPFFIQNLVTGKGPELILNNGSIIDLDSVPDGALIVPGLPFMKKKSTLVYVQMEPNDKVQDQGINILSVPPRRQYQVTLADSSVIKLNASSQLHFPVNFSKNERWVTMKGEAYFEVKANAARPFLVKLKDQVIVKVTGTSFNIDAYNENDYIKTTLVKGHLAIYSNKKSQPLQAGQQVRFTNGSFTMEDKPNIDEVTAWKEGVFDFDNKSIYEIMQEIGHWHNVKIKYNGRMPATPFTARLPRSMPLSEIDSIISEINHIRIERIGDTLIVSPEH